MGIVGFGSYGEVKLARNTENSDIVAIKMVTPLLSPDLQQEREGGDRCASQAHPPQHHQAHQLLLLKRKEHHLYGLGVRLWRQSQREDQVWLRAAQ